MVPEVAGQAQTEALWAAAGLGEHSARALSGSRRLSP